MLIRVNPSKKSIIWFNCWILYGLPSPDPSTFVAEGRLWLQRQPKEIAKLAMEMPS